MPWRWLVVVVVACSKPADPPASSAPPPAKAAPAVTPHEDRHVPATATPRLHVDVVIAGGTPAAWTEAAFAAAPKLAGPASDGKARDTWSLRELVHRNIGPTARVTAVVGAGGTTPIDAAAWTDATRTPILHTTRRGTLKFRWADARGAWGETVVRDVTALDVER
jgi:hypothetical protein